MGRYTPAPDTYEAKSQFVSQKKFTDDGGGVHMSIPKDERNMDKLMVKKDVNLIPAPGFHQSEKFMSGAYGTFFAAPKLKKGHVFSIYLP